MIYVLLIIIAIGVFMISEPGRKILKIGRQIFAILLAIGIIGYLVFAGVLLLSDTAIPKEVVGVISVVLFGYFVAFVGNKDVDQKVKEWFRNIRRRIG